MIEEVYNKICEAKEQADRGELLDGQTILAELKEKFNVSRIDTENIGVLAMRKAQSIAEQNGISEMSLDEINAEIEKPIFNLEVK